ncbi:MAG: hypothetical protein H7Y12_03290 [Sphingobacteriaceae bacterium]|nr:hypothetical protein [Cytophagaceae bacterium]
MLSFDDVKLGQMYVARFGPITNTLADALIFLLRQVEQDTRFSDSDTDRRQLAYCLATFKWETAHTMRPIDEFGSTERFDRLYGPQTQVGKRLGNTQPGDGARFHGRGYVQLTGRANYERAGGKFGIDLAANPDRAKEPVLAYQIAIQGMKEGWFTGRKLSQFFREGQAPDFERARSIINGSDKAQTIADLARRFDEILIFARA